MTLQLALDGAEKGRTLDEAMALARGAAIYGYYRGGHQLCAARRPCRREKKFARAGFSAPILADVKIMDCGAGLCAMACEAGADIVTVMAFASDKTIEGRCARGACARAPRDGRPARHAGCRCGRPRVRALGADIACLHVAVDAQQGQGGPAAAQVAAVSAACGGMPLAVAGGHTGGYRPRALCGGRQMADCGRGRVQRTGRPYSRSGHPRGHGRKGALKMDGLMNTMLQQLAGTVGGAQPQQLAHVARLLQGKKMICTTGAGRTGLVMRMLAMRLAQMGLPVQVAGDVTCGPVGAGLRAGSGLRLRRDGWPGAAGTEGKTGGREAGGAHHCARKHAGRHGGRRGCGAGAHEREGGQLCAAHGQPVRRGGFFWPATGWWHI